MIFHRNELRQLLLRELRKGDPLSSRDLAERICSEEGKDIRDVRMVLDVTRRVSKAMRLKQDAKAVRGSASFLLQSLSALGTHELRF